MDDPCAARQETVSVDFTLRIGEGQISASAAVPAGRATLTQILPILQSLDDSFIAASGAQLAEEGRPISCKPGCAACCRHFVAISLFEAEAIAWHIAGLPAAERQELAQRFHHTLLALSANGLIDRILSQEWLSDEQACQRLTLDYLYQRVDCPFLREETCTIYPIRPFACRDYLATSAPAHCADPAALRIDPVPVPLKFFRALNRIGAELAEDSRGWLPLVFLLAWMKSGARPGEAFSGDGPEVLREFLERAGDRRSVDPET